MKLFLILIYTGCCSAVIYHLNDTEYERMPNLIRLDPYEECLREPGALYCSARFTLVSDTPSPLLDMINEYSEYSATHFNHTRVFQGLCMQKRCKEFITNSSTDLYSQIEACMNKTMWDEYRLKTKIMGEMSCSNEEDAVDVSDLVLAVVVLILLLLNVIGTIYDVIVTEKFCKGTKYLTCFSIRRNFRRLISDPTKDPITDPRVRQLKSLNGVRTISIVMVILGHAMATSAFVQNIHYIEELIKSPLVQLMANGTLLMQIFFIMSGVLLVFNSCLYAETNEISWSLVLKASLLRWLRLAPASALVLAFTATWLRHLGSGPLWNTMVKMETLDCRHYWWWHIIFLNNYNDDSTCLIQYWYIATDMQLSLVGIMIFVFCRNKMKRIAVLSVLFVIGVIVPALHTYYQDLDGTLMITPEYSRRFFITYNMFNHVYKRGHTNLLGCVIGLSVGYLIYYWKDTGIDVEKYKKYRPLYWCWLPALLSLIYAGSIFYEERPRFPILFRTFYAALVKPIFGMLMAIAILGTVLKYEDTYRSILEWDGWTVFSKLGYCAYLLNVTIVKYIIGIQTSLLKSNFVHQISSFTCLLFFAYTGAFFFWMLVEAPFGQLAKTIFKEVEKSGAEEKAENTDIRL